MSKQGALRVGTSGWQYDHWKGVFYPEDLPKGEWFKYFAERFDTVEINNTFYNLPQGKTFQKWADQTPEGFLYVLKFSRYGTHLKYLAEAEDTIGLFLERSAPLADHMGPILVQLPPRWGCNLDRLKGFLD